MKSKLGFDLSQSVLKELGIDESDYDMAIRFTEDFYNENKSAIEELVKKHGKPVLVEMWKEKFFYFVLKWEFNFIDNLGKASALSTDQIDVENGNRYGIEFVDENNTQNTQSFYTILLVVQLNELSMHCLKKQQKILKKVKNHNFHYGLHLHKYVSFL